MNFVLNYSEIASVFIIPKMICFCIFYVFFVIPHIDFENVSTLVNSDECSCATYWCLCVCVCFWLVFFGTLIKNRPDFTVTITIVPFSNMKFALSVHFNGERRLITFDKIKRCQ